MQIIVKKLSGKSITVDVDPSNSVLEVKQKIQNQEGYPNESQRLIFVGKQLEDSRTLSDYSIEEGTVIYLLLPCRGG
jgi:ubiquitin